MIASGIEAKFIEIENFSGSLYFSLSLSITKFSIIYFISLGTPGSKIIVFPLHSIKIPGAAPGLFGIGIAFSGIKAIFFEFSGKFIFRFANLCLSFSSMSLFKTRFTPHNSATTSFVKSSFVGPNPPVEITMSTLFNAVSNAFLRLNLSSPTTVL